MPPPSSQYLPEPDAPVSWAAVVAGAVAALAVSITLVALAAGFGFAFESPWPRAAGPNDAFTPILGSAMIVVQVLSAGLGGYLAGRLRTRWAIHSHEAHFRDTAHGLLVWALSTLMGVVLVAGVMTPPAMEAASSAAAAAASSPQVTGADLGQTLAPTPAVDQARLAAQAERAKNIAAQFSLFMGIGLLLSAFIAAVAAAIGGLRRDEMHDAYHSQLGGVTAP